MKKITIKIPEGSTSVVVEIDGENYPLILKFNDPGECNHYWLEGGVYDGHCAKCIFKHEQGVNGGMASKEEKTMGTVEPANILNEEINGPLSFIRGAIVKYKDTGVSDSEILEYITKRVLG